MDKIVEFVAFKARVCKASVDIADKIDIQKLDKIVPDWLVLNDRKDFEQDAFEEVVDVHDGKQFCDLAQRQAADEIGGECAHTPIYAPPRSFLPRRRKMSPYWPGGVVFLGNDPHLTCPQTVASTGLATCPKKFLKIRPPGGSRGFQQVGSNPSTNGKP